MARNFIIAIFWIAMISIFLMVAPRANQQQGFTSRRADLVGKYFMMKPIRGWVR